MAKMRRKKPAPQSAKLPETGSFDLDLFIDKYIWYIIPLLVLFYYWFSTGSTGFYQDDEIGHYRNIRQFWGDPFSIMGNQPKPGWKILMVVPGLFGFTGVALAHCLVAALTVVMTYKLGRSLGMKNSSVAALLLAVQPLFLQLSFRSYSEITAGLFLVLSLYFYYKDQPILAALTSSYIFSIRQEFALISLGLGVVFLCRRQWLPFLLLAWTPLVLALIGWVATGNITWLLDDMQRIGLGVEVPHRHFWHYFEVYIYMVGPITLALLVLGYVRVFYPFAEAGRRLREHGFLFFTFTVMFAWAVISAWDVPNFGANPGHWRYMLSIAPLTAIYAGKGFNVLLDSRQRSVTIAVLGVFTVLAFAFLARDTNGFTMLETARYDHVAVVLVVALLAALQSTTQIPGARIFTVLLLAGAVGFTLHSEKPRTLDVEAQTVKQSADWYSAQPAALRTRPLLGNHVLFRYFADIDINDSDRDRPLQMATLDAAPIGAICVWDSHYGNSQFGGDVPMEYFQGNASYRLLNQFVAPDQTFGVLVFEKIAETAVKTPTQGG